MFYYCLKPKKMTTIGLYILCMTQSVTHKAAVCKSVVTLIR